MNRSRFIVAVLALGGLVGAAEYRSTLLEQQQRLKAFQEKALEARKAQKLDDNHTALVSKYPTPELEFIEPVEARSGAEVTLSVPGQFVPGSLVLVPCEGVEVLSTKVTKERAEARVRIRPSALPGDCDLQVVSPVSAIARSTTALRIRGEYELELKLSNGLTTRWTVEMGEDFASLHGLSEWFEKGQPVGTRPVVIAMRGQNMRASVGLSGDESQTMNQAYANTATDMEALGKKMEAVMQKMQSECSKVPLSRQEACTAKYRAQLETFTRQVNSNMEQAQKSASAASRVCTDLRLQAVDGKVTGTAENCAGLSSVKVTGTYKPSSGK